MTELDETTCEQLSAWMDGALPAEEARFLERRLQHDMALREKWERLQVASACLRGHEVLAMSPDLPVRIAAALAAEQPSPSRRGWIGWAVAASVAIAVVALVPRWSQDAQAPAPLVASSATAPAPGAAPPPPTAATPGLADFLTESPAATPTAGASAALPATAVASAPATPSALPSPAEFPLDPSAQPKAWPRSAAPGGADAAMEGYLVRHSEMVGGDGLGGFVPYLDVVASGEPEPALTEGEDAGQ